MRGPTPMCRSAAEPARPSLCSREAASSYLQCRGTRAEREEQGGGTTRGLCRSARVGGGELDPGTHRVSSAEALRGKVQSTGGRERRLARVRAPAQQRCRGEEKAWQGTRLRAPGEVGSTERVGSCTLCCAQQSDGKETGGEGYSGSAAASPSCCSLLLTTVQPSSQSGPAVPRTSQERRGRAHQEHESRASSRVNKPWAPSEERRVWGVNAQTTTTNWLRCNGQKIQRPHNLSPLPGS